MDSKKVDWMMCERIANEDHVDEALRVFSEDATQDNATGLIQAALTVYLADTSAAAPQVVADERANISQNDIEMVEGALSLCEIEDQQAFGRIKRAALAAAPVQAQEPVAEIHCQEFHELAMDYRGASFSQAPVAYESLCEYIKRLVTPVQPVAVPDGCDCDDGLVWEGGCTSPCEKCQDVTDDSAAAPAAQGDAVKLECCGSTEFCERVTCPAQGDAKDAELIAVLLKVKNRLQFADKHIDCGEEIAAIDAAIAAKAAS